MIIVDTEKIIFCQNWPVLDKIGKEKDKIGQHFGYKLKICEFFLFSGQNSSVLR